MGAQLLMCPPHYFGVNYSINPWMEGQVGRVDAARARRQWADFYGPISRMAEVALIPPREGTPDMVFTANAGLPCGTKFIPSRFKHEERRREEPHFLAWFREQGFDIVPLPDAVAFEGAGDALFQPDGHRLWAGFGFRTDPEVPALLEKILGGRVVPLRLTDRRFYHLDTCLCPLHNGTLLYYPPAFDAASRRRIEEHAGNPIPVPEEDALHFACNAVLVGNTLFMNFAGPELRTRLEQEGYEVRVHVVDEFLKAGGANKCLTISLQ